MDPMRAIDAYCERLGPTFWAEPANAITNAAFLVAALLAWRMARRAGRSGDWGVRALAAVTAAIGVGSFLFHTVATAWASAADVIPILVFIMLYLHLTTVRLFQLPVWAGMGAMAMFLPVSVALGWTLRAALGPLNGSSSYGAVLIVIMCTGAALIWTGREAAGRGLLTGGAIFFVSIIMRTLDAQDGAVCAGLPLGTHFMWHLLNGVLLGWMMAVMIRHGAPAAHRGARGRGALGGGRKHGGA